MDQTNALADALLKTPSLLSGLLSQIGGAFGQAGIGADAFSNLLSNNVGATPATLNRAPTTTSTDSVNNSTGAATPFAATASGITTSTLPTLQKLSSLSSTLQKILSLLRHHSDNAATQNNNAKAQQATADNAADQTTDAATSIDSTEATTGTTSAASVTDTQSTDATDPSQTLAEIVAELLLLTQMMMRSLQMTATSTAQTQGQAAQQANNLIQMGAVDANAADTGQKNSDPLMNLMDLLQKAARQLVPQADDLAPSSGSTDFASALPTPTTTLSSADLTSQLSLLDADLKKVIAALETTIGNATPAQKEVSPTPQTASTVTENLLSTLVPSAITQDTTTTNDIQASAAGPTPVTASVIAAQTVPGYVQAPQLMAAPAKPAAQQNTLVNTDNTKSSVNNPAANAAAITTAASEKTETETETDSNTNLEMAFSKQAAQDFSSSSQSSLPISNGAQALGTYNFASQLSAFRAVNGGATGLPSVVDQVILQMNRGVKSGSDEISVQLHPADLGKITVKLDLSDGKVQGTVTADNPKTLEMLQKDSRSLERALQDAGLRADPGSLQFNLGGQPGNNTNASTYLAGNGNPQDEGNNETALDFAEADTAPLSETYYITPTGVNIEV